MSGSTGDNSVVVRFVKPSLDSPASSVFQEAFEAIQDISAESVWFTENECLSVETKERKFIYLFEDFKGPAFEKIVSSGNRIYGPVCVLHCLKNNVALPKESHPVFSLSMQGCVISCTSIEKKTRDWIHKYVQWMMGEVSKDFHQNVTHLVAAEVGSKKYLVAAKLNKKIMSPDWVEKVWETAKSSFVKADDPCYDKYRCPLFKGFVVTVSGLDSTERGRIKDIVQKEGGTYSGEMKINECTHLVVNVPRGQKYEFAKQWKIHIVNPKWLFDSLDAGYCLEERDFPVGDRTEEDMDRRGHGTSTPTRRSSTRLSEIPDVSAISISHVNETNMTMLSNSSMVSMKNHTILQGNQTTPTSDQTMISGNQTLVSGNRTVTAPQSAEVLDTLDITKSKGDLFLDGCKVFLSGFKGAHLEKLKKMINIGGGTRLNQITESVTHVVMGEQLESHITQLKESSFRPHVVSLEWIVACFTSGEQVKEEDYNCLELPTLQSASPKTKQRKPTQKANKSVMDKGDGPSTSVPEQMDQEVLPPGGAGDMHNLLSQYLPENTSKDTMGESTLMRAAEMGEEAANQVSLHEKPANQIHANIEPVANQNTSIIAQPANHGNDTTIDPDATMDEGQSSLFHGKTFVILGFDIANEQEMMEYIKVFQGKVLPVTTRKVPDFAIVPVFGCPVTMTVGDIVTNAWVQMCIEQEQLLPLESDPMFQPISITPDSTPLEGCVLSLSGYSGTERDALIHMATVLGATVQEYFVKRANPAKNLAPSSHLVVNAAEGSKYNAAKKWNLPAVTKNWIVECAKQNQHLPEDLYLVDRPPDPSTVATTDISILNEGKGHGSAGLTSHSVTKLDQESLETNLKTRKVEIPADAEMEVDSNENEAVENMEIDHQVAAVTRTPEVRESQKENRLKSRASRSSVSTPNVAPDKENSVRLTDTPLVGKKPLRGAQTLASTPKLVNHRVRELVAENRDTPKPQKAPDNSWTGVESPSVFLNPNKSFHARFDLADAMADLQSPGTPRTPGGTKHKRKNSMGLEEVFAFNLDLAVKNQLKFKDQGIHESTPYSQRIRTALDEDHDEEPQGPLHGVVIAVSKKLSTQQSEYNNIAASLGADYRWTYDRSCTHFIFQGRQNDTNKEFRLAKDQGKIIVSPHWLNMCQEQGCRVDEMLFPHTFNPNLSLTFETVTPARSTRRSARTRGASTRSDDKTPSPPEISVPVVETLKNKPMFDSLNTTQSDEEIAQVAEGVEEKESESNTQAIVDNIKSLIATTKTYSKTRRGTRRTDSFSKVAGNEGPGSAKRSRLSSSNKTDGVSPRSSRGERRPARLRNSRSKTETQTEASQIIEVSWDDPAAREQQLKLAMDLAKNSEASEHESSSLEEDLSNNDNQDPSVAISNKKVGRLSMETEHRIPTPEAPSIAFPLPRRPADTSPPRQLEMMEEPKPTDKRTEQKTTPLILMSGMGQDERDDYGALVEALGGVIIDSGQYDPRCTHLIVGNPARNEKYLSSVAAGKWVLHKSYFEACREANRFVEEEPHEWGSSHTAKILKGHSAQVAKLAQAAHRWRHWFHQQNNKSLGAFNGWQVMLLTEKKREDGFRRLLEAGGGTIITTKYPCLDIEDITHAFIDMHKIKFKVDLEELVSAEIHCLKPEYIAAYLMDDPQPQPKEHYISEVQPLLKKLGGDPRKRKASGTEAPSTPSSKRYRR